MVWVVSLLTVKLSPTVSLLLFNLPPFGVWLGLVTGEPPLAHSVLYLRQPTNNAAPKGISRRTSYLLVRLAFHLYPQFIRSVCNLSRFGPPRSFTSASS